MQRERERERERKNEKDENGENGENGWNERGEKEKRESFLSFFAASSWIKIAKRLELKTNFNGIVFCCNKCRPRFFPSIVVEKDGKFLMPV